MLHESWDRSVVIVLMMPHMKIVSRASRPGLLVGLFRILCDGLCTAHRFHTDELDHTCRIGCPDELDSLTHYNECPGLYNIFSFSRDMLRYCHKETISYTT